MQAIGFRNYKIISDTPASLSPRLEANFFVLGGTARLQYGITNNFAVTLTSGADHFLVKICGTDIKYDSFGII